MITVAKDNSGDFTSIQDAVNSISNGPETIYIKNGIYKERVEVTTPLITFEGEDVNNTVITEGYYAKMIGEDGEKLGTFRSYTFFVHTNNFTARNITFENSAGFGRQHGQGLAVYAEGDMIEFDNCRMLGHQDTLFTGPLPFVEKQPGGFVGPTEFEPRVNGRQIYRNCYICGEVDFIFGSATAYFKDCELHALDRNEDINGYYTAPSTYEGQKYGYVFESCNFTGECPDRTFYLSRPWRIYAKTVFLNCNMGKHIKEEGYSDWNKPESHDTCYYAEYNCTGEGYLPDMRPAYIHQLTNEEAAEYTEEKVLASL